MATVTTKQCDGCKILNAVEYRVSSGVDGSPAVNRKLDLCPACIERAERFIDRGLTPPTKRAKKETP